MSSYVHDLVFKMTKREKGYFITTATKSLDNKNYLRLYSYVEQNKTYDISEVRSKFKNETIGKYLSSEYNYLAKCLLRSLVNFHFNKSEKNKIQESILFINVLLSKDIRNKAIKIHRVTKNAAYKNENFSQILILIDLEEEILFKQGILGFTSKLKELEIERKTIIDKINNLNQFRYKRAQIRELWYNNGFAKKENLIIDDPILESVDNALSLKAKLHWYYIKAMLLYINQHHKKAIKIYLKGIDLIESNDHLFNRESLFVLYSNCLENLAIIKDSKLFFATLKKLQEIGKGNYTLYIEHSRTLELYYHLEEFDNGAYYSEKAYEFINKNELPHVQINYLYLLIIRLNILNRKFSNALQQINEWKMIRTIDLFESHIKLFTLIIYHELEYTILLKSEIESTIKLLKRRKRYDYFIQKMVAFFKNSIRNSEKELTFLKKLQLDLITVKHDHTDLKDWKLFKYNLWIESRISFLQNGTE